MGESKTDHEGIYIIEFEGATGEALAISARAVHWPKLAQITSNTATNAMTAI
jgi:hypothetical protein